MPRLTRLLALTLAALLGCAHAADPQRQADVARRGADVMPFSLDATTHVFTKTPEGGIQRVVAKNVADAQQVQLVRNHLREIRHRFRMGDFSGPSSIHGEQMPGLAELRAAKPGELAIQYRQLPAGAELLYRAERPELVAAVHRWFDAQVADHGAHAQSGDMPHSAGHMHKH